MAIVTPGAKWREARYTIYRTTTPLGISGVFNTPLASAFEGAAAADYIDARGFDQIVLRLHSDVASATDGVKVYGSDDGSTDHETLLTATLSAATGYSVLVDTPWDYVRVVYTNGGTGQATFSATVEAIQRAAHA